jgi:prepilin-type N-terminal cleavage/methylation domain-containing protein
MMRNQHGFTLIELLTAIAILGLTFAIAVPQWQSLRRRAAVRAAATELRAIFRDVRMRAITRASNSGVKFAQGAGGWTYTMYDDGDGDGVRNDDIKSGVDRRVKGPLGVLSALNGSMLASISLPSTVAIDPDGSKFAAGASPVQFGVSTICSFSPVGESTPGTIYLADAAGDAYAVRVFGGSARVRLIHYDAKRRRWEEK